MLVSIMWDTTRKLLGSLSYWLSEWLCELVYLRFNISLHCGMSLKPFLSCTHVYMNVHWSPLLLIDCASVCYQTWPDYPLECQIWISCQFRLVGEHKVTLLINKAFLAFTHDELLQILCLNFGTYSLTFRLWKVTWIYFCGACVAQR